MKFTWVLLGILGILTECWGIALDRAVPANREHAGPFEKFFDGEIKVPGIEKFLQAKKSLKPEDEMKNNRYRGKRSELLVSENPKNRIAKGLDEFKDDFIFPMEENLYTVPKEDEKEKPQNVVLLFIDESGQDRQELWNSLRTSSHFPVYGFLQTCQNEGLRFSLDGTPVSGREYDCECENFLRGNVASLLSWAQRAKEMATGAVSVTNSSIPTPLEYDSLIFGHNSENSEKNKMKISKSRIHDEWHLIDVNKGNMSSAPPPVSSTPKQEGAGMWDVFDTFSKIRIAIFRNWLETLHKNSGKTQDKFSAKTTISVGSELVELMGHTIDELKSISDDKGFIMVAIAPGNEISPAIKILQTEIPPKDTLLIVSGICSQERKLVPFFASGPGSKYLYEARTICDINSAVRKAVSGCYGILCEVESLNPVRAPDHEIHRRFPRAKANDEKDPNSAPVTNSTTETAEASTAMTENAENSTVNHSNHKKNETLGESGEKLTDKSTEKSVPKLTEKFVEESTDISTEQSVSKSTEKLAKKSSGKLAEESTEKPTEKSVFKSIEKSTEKSTEESVSETTKKPAGKSSLKLVKGADKILTETTTENSPIQFSENKNPKENLTAKSSETPSTKLDIRIQKVEETSQSENLKNVQVAPKSIPNSGASGFSMKLSAIIVAITSFAAIIVLDF